MKHEKIMGLLILSEVALVALGLLSEFAFAPLLPSSLTSYLASDTAAAFGLSDTLLTVLWVVVVTATILAWIGLLNLLRAARVLYLGSWVGYMVLLLLRGPVVSTAVSHVVQMLTALVGGAIVGIIYFSELRTRFRKLSEVVGGPQKRSLERTEERSLGG